MDGNHANFAEKACDDVTAPKSYREKSRATGLARFIVPRETRGDEEDDGYFT